MPSASSMASTRKYPFIRTEFFNVGSGRLFNRILNEARAGKVLFDLVAVSSRGLKIFLLGLFCLWSKKVFQPRDPSLHNSSI